MKKIIFPVLMAALSALVGCSEKIKVAAPYKNITVIYGFLEMKDTAHYIRVQKAFLDNEKSGLEMAKSADSSFYNNIHVRIERYKAFSTKNTFVDSFALERVDLNTEGYPKQPGLFFQAPNYAYKFRDALDPSMFYRIVVINTATGQRDSADAPVIDDVNPARFGIPIIDEPLVNGEGMTFVQPKKFFELEGIYDALPGYNFYGQFSPASVAQAIIRFNWADSSASGKVYKSCEYNAGYLQLDGKGIDYKIDNSKLIFALRDGMGKAPDGVDRYMDRSDIMLYLSTPDFYTYYQVQLNKGTGLTGSEVQPAYTNIKGSALGLFTSRGMRGGKVSISKRTVDSLKVNPILADMRIRGTVY